MEKDLVHKENLNGYTIRIFSDDSSESPRDWDNLGTIVTWTRNYSLGDQQPKESPDEWVKDFREAHKLKYVILPVYLYDHSGLRISTTPFSCPWDSGQIGWIYATYAKLRKEYGWKHITKKRIAKAKQYLQGEVNTYDDFLCGNCHGYTISHGERELDSCWGFLGDKEVCLEEARSAAKAIEKADLPLFRVAGLLDSPQPTT